MRLNFKCTASASVLISSVFARPGTPRNRQCPPARNAVRISAITSSWPMITRRSSFCREPTRAAVSDKLISINSSRLAGVPPNNGGYCEVMNTWTSLSNDIEAAVEKAAPSIVQVHGHRRMTAGLVIADNLIATPAATDEDKVAVLAGNNATEGVVLG